MQNGKSVRLQILRKAQEQFFTHGFSKVTTEELAAELGISKKTLYQHFASKDELLREAVYLMRDEVAAAVNAIVDDPKMDAVEKLRLLMMTVGTKLSQMRRPYFEDLRRKAPELWQEVEQFRREHILASFERLIVEGGRKGVLRKGIDPHFFVLMFYAVVQNVFNPDVLSQLSFTPQVAFETLMKVMMEGVLTDEAKARFSAPADGSRSSKRS